MIDHYAVMGHPVGHSQSPFIHSRFAEQTGQSMRYTAIDVAPGEFPRAVALFRAGGGQGLNITLPHKEQAFDLCEERTPRAEQAGAVNTLWFDSSDGVHGDNTDGVGLIRDLCDNHGMSIAGRRVLLVGAGGAARGALGPLLDARPRRLVCANRTPKRAEALVRQFPTYDALEACAFPALEDQVFDLIINATSASLQREVPALPDTVLNAGGCCYDMMYGREPTAFVAWGRAHGAAKSVDGLGMLVEQAAESFFLWRGVRPATATVIAALRTAFRHA